MLNKYLKSIAILLNPFAPGSANIISGNYFAGTLIVIAYQVIFFATPYISIDMIKTLYTVSLITSFSIFFIRGRLTRTRFTEKKRNRVASLLLSVSICTLSFLTLSFLSFNLTHRLVLDRSSNNDKSFVYVLGTKPFKQSSTQNMLKMSDKELIKKFNNNSHPFFMRLKAGLKKVNENTNSQLIISAGKYQKKIANRIINKLGHSAIYFSCKSTKEEISALKRYLDRVNANDTRVIIVSDDYHAFRVMLYSKFNGLQNVRFFPSRYVSSKRRFLKRYAIEQTLFLLSFSSLPVSLTGIVI